MGELRLFVAHAFGEVRHLHQELAHALNGLVRAAARRRENLPEEIDGPKQQVEHLRGDLETTEPQVVEHGLQLVAQRRHGGRAEETGEPLQRVHGAEHFVEQLGIVALGAHERVEREQIAAQRVEDLLRLGEELFTRAVANFAHASLRGESRAPHAFWSSAWSSGFFTKALAPSDKPRSMSRGVTCVEMMTTGMSASAAELRMYLMSSRPWMPGMLMSVTQSENDSRESSCSASTPFLASTTSMAPAASAKVGSSRMPRTSARVEAESSTTRTLCITWNDTSSPRTPMF